MNVVLLPLPDCSLSLAAQLFPIHAVMPNSSDASALATLQRATPASSVVPTHRPLVRADDHEAAARALRHLAAARVLACPAYSRRARRYTAILDAMDVAASVMGVDCRSGQDSDGGIGSGSGSGGGSNGDLLSAVLARPAKAVANASRSNELACLDAATPLEVAVATMAERGAHWEALVEADGGTMQNVLTQSAVVAWLVHRGIFGVPSLEAAVESAFETGGRGGQAVTAGNAAVRPVVCLIVREGVLLWSMLARLLRGDSATVVLVSADDSGLDGKLFPADVRALLGGVVADAGTADPTAADAAFDAALDVVAVAGLGGQTLTTTARASAPAGGGR